SCAGLDRPSALDHGRDVVAGFGHSVTVGAFAHTTRALRRSSSPPHERTRLSRHAAFETFPDLLLRQLAADEDDAAFALLAVLPRPLVIAVEDHVHALEHETLVVSLERKNALAAENVGAFLLHEVLHPRKELFGIERLVGLERPRLHLLVVIMLEPAAVLVVIVIVLVTVAVMMVVMIVVVIMIVVMAAVVEKFRLDLQDTIEIEGVALEHLRQRD